MMMFETFESHGTNVANSEILLMENYLITYSINYRKQINT
jgi:hypothetical protein